ncbi:HSP20 family protein [Alkalibacillus filiformis]|uniref:HSP20 family protein n=1 Tax=Alkalibacillus filiformis TaxID=200990 RepID=A0ABU0DU12_9BACI|nr:Hsp20/alpha crystallin family protein [Alkalibacillus filiformis]MDQ0351845.1 HSP20 family protein [Alkalibacillus filiformis]
MNPFSQFNHMHDWKDQMERFFGDSFWDEFESTLKPNFPPVNILRKDYEILCVFNIPGIDHLKRIDCQVKDYSLLIKGQININVKGYEMIQEELIQGSFERVIELPCKVRKDKISARYEHGLVWVKLYKDVHQDEHGRSINIQQGKK